VDGEAERVGQGHSGGQGVPGVPVLVGGSR
jgi:hypothetical protein